MEAVYCMYIHAREPRLVPGAKTEDEDALPDMKLRRRWRWQGAARSTATLQRRLAAREVSVAVAGALGVVDTLRRGWV